MPEQVRHDTFRFQHEVGKLLNFITGAGEKRKKSGEGNSENKIAQIDMDIFSSWKRKVSVYFFIRASMA
ncbi:MAG: hypothetical protein C4560_01845 [Nitrospiraceae bacterium]|nr:MAG: hypothetical protein C4560_01845 [Nitrospiraceae bacterium]